MEREPKSQDSGEGAGIKSVPLNSAIVDHGRSVDFPRHQHIDHETIIVERGEYRCRLNGEELLLRPYSLVMVNPGDWHEDAYRPPMRYLAVNLRLLPSDGGPQAHGVRMLREGLPAKRHCLALDEAIFKPLIARMLAESVAKDNVSRRIRDSLWGEFTWLLARLFRFDDLSREVQADLGAEAPSHLKRQLASLFDARITGICDVAEMAAVLGMSESSLAHRCKEELGLGPAAAFSRHKMQRAFELLSRTQMNLKEISEFLGFKNPYHFSKVFKRAHGVPPGAVRRRET